MVIEQQYVRLYVPATGVCSDPVALLDGGGNIITIGVQTPDGVYRQYDTYEAWYLETWATPLGIVVQRQTVQVHLPDEGWKQAC